MKVFSRLFDRAAPLWRAAETIGDIITVNIMLLLTAVPVVTLGAGLTAAYDTAHRLQSRASEEGAARLFWRSFRANFGKATVIWLVVGTMGVGLLASWMLFLAPELVVLKMLATIVYLLVFPCVWALQARFENTALRTLRNAALVAVARLPFTLGVLAVQTAVVAVVVATWIYLPQLVALLLLLGYPLAIFAATPLLDRALAVLLPPEAEATASAAVPEK